MLVASRTPSRYNPSQGYATLQKREHDCILPFRHQVRLPFLLLPFTAAKIALSIESCCCVWPRTPSTHIKKYLSKKVREFELHPFSLPQLIVASFCLPQSQFLLRKTYPLLHWRPITPLISSLSLFLSHPLSNQSQSATLQLLHTNKKMGEGQHHQPISIQDASLLLIRIACVIRYYMKWNYFVRLNRRIEIR